MSLWSSNKNFRNDYVKRILPSLDARQLSRDGRMKNPDEKSIGVSDGPRSSNVGTGVQVNARPVKEDPKSSKQQETSEKECAES